jgi:Tol biopolymer transport system component
LPADAQVTREIVGNPLEKVDAVAIDDAGTVVYAISTTNQFGTNPDHRKQIVRWDPATGIGSQVTNFEEGADTISVSDDGAWLAFVSSADPLSTNHDESAEVFVMHPDGTGLAQLTSGSFLPHEQRGIRAAVISGSGNRVAFVGRVNPLGTNSTYLLALFVIDRDGTNLRQLATDVEIADEHPSSGDKDRSSFDISDDGSKVVFMKAGQIWGINANGTASHTFSSTTGADEVSIAGNGGRIVYAFDGLTPSVRTRTFDGNPGTIVTILGERPLLTDDSTLVYFHGSAAPAGIWKVSATGGAATSVAPGLRPVRMSGNGARLTARGGELVALDNTGGSLQQLSVTSLLGDDLYDPSLTSDGNKLRFFSTFDPLGTNSGHQIEMFEYSFESGVLTQLTDASVPTFLAEFVSDSGVAVFDAGADLTGQNPCGRSQVFRWDPVGGVVQLTICHPQSINSDPKITADGQHVLYYDNEFNSGGLYIMNADGTGRMPVPMVPSGR